MQENSAHFSVHLAREQNHDMFLTWGLFIFHRKTLSGTLSSTCFHSCCYCSVDKLCMTLCKSATPRTTAFQVSLSFTISWSLLKVMSIESGMLSNYLILCCPLLFLPSIFPNIRGFSNESILCIRWPKYWSFSFSINPSNEYLGLISFRIDWCDLLAVQGTQESSPAPQFKSINFSVLCILYGPTLKSIHDHWKSHSLD